MVIDFMSGQTLSVAVGSKELRFLTLIESLPRDKVNDLMMWLDFVSG